MVVQGFSEWKIFRFTAVGCAVVAMALILVSVVGDVVGARGTRAVSDSGLVVFSGLAAVTCFRAARARTRQRLPWLLLAVAASSYTVGNTIWFYYQVLSPETQTFPGPADIFYVALVPFVVAGMLALPRQSLSAAGRARAVADGLIMAAALLFVSWILVVGPLFDQLGTASPLYLLVYLYYPLSDIVVISIAGVMALRATGAERLPLLLVAVGFIAIGSADTGIGYLALQGEDAAGSGFDVGWTVGYMLLALAALVPVAQPARRHRAAADPRALSRELLPYVPVTVVLVIIAASPDRLTDGRLVIILVSLTMLLVVRHLLTLADNVGLTRDLENRVQQRTRELERLTGQHQSILDSAGEGIIGLDRTSSVTFANPAAGEIVGRPAEELVGSVLQQVLRLYDGAGAEVPEADHPVTAAMAEGRVQTLTDAVHRRLDGAEVPIELTVTPRRDAGEVTGAVVLFRDVTEQRALDKMKDEFVSVVSHELRTPLTSVRGALGLLQGGLLADAPPKAQRMITIAVESTDRLIRLINDILDVERIAAGSLAANRRECSADELVERAVGEMRGLALQSDVTLDKSTSSGRFHADPDRIVQMLTNLIGNAIKFSPPGGTVRISAVKQAGSVLFTVSDEGRGIPADQLEAVFGRFVQIDSADTRDQGGTGLGLAICRGIVELHGGRIWAESTPGRGATFKVMLPAAPDGVDSEVGPERTPEATVLVYETDPRARSVICRVLTNQGYRVIVADSAEQAVSEAAAHAPAAIAMDLARPGAGAWDAFGALRADERTRDVPIVALGGSDKDAPPVDVSAWLTGPLDVGELLAALDRAVHGLGDRPRILLVEDDPSLGAIMRALFGRHGVQARQALNGREALEMCRDVPPDLILLDLLLPDVDGFALAKELNAGPDLKHIPLVVYSALELDDDDRARLGVDPDQCFTKASTRPEEVERRVLDLLDHLITGAAR
ncbi:ATP-binding protein [Kribbella sp. NPDC023972]|uniref:ATP-binding protein n=1 Tax=Kribbella sp. NPDC023972 TaxID=3154795 RepID=UPI0033F8673F